MVGVALADLDPGLLDGHVHPQVPLLRLEVGAEEEDGLGRRHLLVAGAHHLLRRFERVPQRKKELFWGRGRDAKKKGSGKIEAQICGGLTIRSPLKIVENNERPRTSKTENVPHNM